MPTPAEWQADRPLCRNCRRPLARFDCASSSDVLDLLPGLLIQEAAEFQETATLQCGLLPDQSVVLLHHQNKVCPGLCQRKNFIVLLSGFCCGGLYQKMFRAKGSVGGIGAQQGLALGEIGV